jgi:hypothetical protein
MKRGMKKLLHNIQNERAVKIIKRQVNPCLLITIDNLFR